MKIGMRKPSVKKSISARTTGRMKRAVKRSVDPTYGKKGIGIFKDTKKSVYNKVYDKTTFDIRDVISNSGDDDFSEYRDNLNTVPKVKMPKSYYKIYKFVVLPIGIITFLLSLLAEDKTVVILSFMPIAMSLIALRAYKNENK